MTFIVWVLSLCYTMASILCQAGRYHHLSLIFAMCWHGSWCSNILMCVKVNTKGLIPDGRGSILFQPSYTNNIYGLSRCQAVDINKMFVKSTKSKMVNVKPFLWNKICGRHPTNKFKDGTSRIMGAQGLGVSTVKLGWVSPCNSSMLS